MGGVRRRDLDTVSGLQTSRMVFGGDGDPWPLGPILQQTSCWIGDGRRWSSREVGYRCSGAALRRPRMELVGEYIIVTGVRSQAEYEGGQLQMAPLSGMLTSSHILHKTLFLKGTSRPTFGSHALIA